MPIKVKDYFYGEKRRRGEGLRLGCTRYLVRGVRKKNYAKWDIMDVWLPTLAPSVHLLAWAKRKDFDDPKRWATFIARYRIEMKKTAPRQTIRALAKLSKWTPISFGCYCQGNRCHRFELAKMIRAAAVGKF